MSFYSVLGMALFIALLFASRTLFVRAWVNNDYVGVEGYVTYPEWPVRLIILVGCVGCIIEYAILAMNHLRQTFSHAGVSSSRGGLK
jgi:hypothetical protein